MNHDDDQQPERGLMPMGEILGGLFGAEMLPAKEGATPTDTEKQPKEKRRISAKIEAAGAEIAARPDETEAAFLARELVQCTLPHRNPGDVSLWVRRNGDFALGLQPGSDLKNGQIHRLALRLNSPLGFAVDCHRSHPNQKPPHQVGSDPQRFFARNWT